MLENVRKSGIFEAKMSENVGKMLENNGKANAFIFSNKISPLWGFFVALKLF